MLCGRSSEDVRDLHITSNVICRVSEGKNSFTLISSKMSETRSCTLDMPVQATIAKHFLHFKYPSDGALLVNIR